MSSNRQDVRRGLGIRARLIIIFIGIFTVALIIFAAALSVPLTQLSVDFQQQSLNNEVYSVSTSLAEDIFGEDLKQILDSGDVNDPASDFVVDALSFARNVGPNTGWAYTVAPDPDSGELVYINVVQFEEGGGYAVVEDLFLQPYAPIGGSGQIGLGWVDDALGGGLAIAPEVYETDGGQWLSGFAPITDDSGQIVGLVGADIKAEGSSELIATILGVVGLSFVLVYPLLLVTIFLAASSIVRPIQDISDAAEALEAEERVYSSDQLKRVVKRGDELGQLSRVFDRMAIEVQAREQRLKEQLTQLKIEIDTSKQEQQVSEITETDYFQDLQAKSLKLRQKRQTDTDLKVARPDQESDEAEE